MNRPKRRLPDIGGFLRETASAVRREGVAGLSVPARTAYHKLLQQGSRVSSPGRSIYERDWEILVVLDACRYDLFADAVSSPDVDYKFIDRGSLTTARSVESATRLWMRRTFGPAVEAVERTHYVVGNPWSARELDEAWFASLDPVWRDAWDDDHGTLPPETVTDRALTASHKAVASTRTLVLFEVKLVDETIAVLLFFTAVLYLALATREHRAVVGLAVVIAALALTHHATSVFFGLLLACMLGASLIERVPLPGMLARRLYPQRGKPINAGIPGTVAVALGVGAVFIFLAPQVTTELVNTAYGALFEGQQTAAPAQSDGGGGIFSVSGVPPRQLISRAAILVFALMAGVTAFGILTRYDTAYWEVGWTGAASIFAMLYFASLVGGRVVPLDPIRILLFLVATITPPTLSIISRVQLPHRLSQLLPAKRVFSAIRGAVAVLIVTTLILTQVAAFAPHILYTNPDETVIGEGHHTSAQFGASQWTERHYSGAVLGAERSLWVAHDNNYPNPIHGEGACESLLTVWRPETGDPRPADVSVVFDSTDVSLTRADTEPYIPGKASNTQASPNYNSGPPECGTFVRSKFTKGEHAETSP